MKKVVLRENIISHFKVNNKPIVYGKKGETVEIIYDSITAFVVKNKEGKTFPINNKSIF